MLMVSVGDIRYWLLENYISGKLMAKVGPLEIFLFICFLFNIGLGILVFTRSSSRKSINTVFSLFCLACALWIFGALMIHTIGWVKWKLASLRFIFAVSCFMPAP